MHNPRARFAQTRLTARMEVPPTDPTMLALYNILRKGSVDPVVKEACDLFDDPEHCAAMDAFLLAGAQPPLIYKVLGVRPEVTAAYAYLFMDTGGFRNKLEILSFVNNYEASAHGRELLKAAVNVGIEYLLWAFGVPNVEVDPRQIIRHTMAESYYRGMAHRGNSVTSPVTKEAFKWWSSAVKNAELLEKIDPRAEKQAFEEIRIQLEKFDDTYTADAAPVDVTDILH